jgi:hypothetical protein
MMGKTTFSDGNKSLGIKGTIVTADFLNAVNNHRHTGRDLDGDGAIDYAADTGEANAYVIALSPSLDALITGMPVFFKAANTNTGSSTLKIDDLDAVAIKKNVSSALGAGDITAGQIVMVIYDGTYFQLFSVPEEDSLYAVDTGNPNAYVITLPQAPASFTGRPIVFKAANTNTGASTLNINGSGAVPIKKRISEALVAGDIVVGQTVVVIYDGTYFQLINNGQAVDLGQFAHSLASSGYQKLPGGLIIQWGLSAELLADHTLAITFPISFPTACVSVLVTGNGTTVTGNPAYSGGAGNVTGSGFTLANDGVDLTYWWAAIGY